MDKHNKELKFEELVAMYINDCMQYLKGEADFTQTEFEPTTDQDEIINGLRELKDLCMKKMGVEPMPWEKVVIEKGGSD